MEGSERDELNHMMGDEHYIRVGALCPMKKPPALKPCQLTAETATLTSQSACVVTHIYASEMFFALHYVSNLPCLPLQQNKFSST